MCLYRKSLYVCNHSQICGEPMTACQAQREYASGAAKEPCDRVETHARNTIRVSRLCAPCRDKKLTVDKQLDVVKSRMAELRKHLDESYDNCMKHLDEAGLDHEDKPGKDSGGGGSTTTATARKTNSTGGKGKGKKAPEPAEEDPPVDPGPPAASKTLSRVTLDLPEKEEDEEEERFWLRTHNFAAEHTMYIRPSLATVRPPLRHHHLAKRDDGISGGAIIAIIVIALILSVLAARAVAMVVWKQPFCPGCGGKERKRKKNRGGSSTARSREGGSAV
ncbi:hypothetical protein F4809DRAFT_664943 [Biscogniauxia mediterranea]|nr:hypothetical protein F4809DRAFT_664943 [Biscogniauxia mediterranea]